MLKSILWAAILGLPVFVYFQQIQIGLPQMRQADFFVYLRRTVGWLSNGIVPTLRAPSRSFNAVLRNKIV